MKKRFIIISMIFTLIDQIIKIIVSNVIELNNYIKIVDKFFYITNVHNKGAAFSILNGKGLLLIVISIFALYYLYNKVFCADILKNKNIFIISMLYGGIIGNLIDRIVRGYVIDYLDFIIFNYDYPVFNFADILIVLSFALLIFKTIKEDICKNSKSKKMLEE